MNKKVRSVIWNMVQNGYTFEAISNFSKECQTYVDEKKEVIKKGIQEVIKIKKVIVKLDKD